MPDVIRLRLWAVPVKEWFIYHVRRLNGCRGTTYISPVFNSLPAIKMDINQLAQILACTLDPNLRVEAERQLNEVYRASGFVSRLLQVVMSTEVQQPIRQAGGIYLKNMITQCWRDRDPKNCVDVEMPFVISAEDKNLIRNNIIEAIIHSPELIRLQLTVCIGKILIHDFPEHWPTAPRTIHNYLSSDNKSSWFGALVALYQIVKKYEFKKAEQRTVLNDTMKEFLPLMYQRCASLMQDQSQPATEIKKMVIKTLFAVFQYHLPTDVLTEQNLPTWVQLYQAIVDQQVPEECTQLDEEEQEKSSWWKLKKWAIHSMCRLFERYGTPGSIDKAYETFATYFCKTFAVGNTQTVLKVLDNHRRKIYVAPRVLQMALNYLKNGVSNALHWKVMKPHMHTIIVEIVFPIMCHTDEDEELWQDDPYEFIRFKYDVYEDFVSPVTAAQSLLRGATQKRKQILDPVMNFCVQILNTPAETRNPRQKDGVLHMIGTLSDILLKKKKYKDHMEAMLVHHVFDETRSPLGFVRARACWVLNYFSRIAFKNEANLQRAVEAVRVCLLHDKELPVKVEAALALQFFIKRQDKAKDFIQPYMQAVIQELLNVIRETENDDLTDALQDLIKQYQNDPRLGEMAVIIAQHLAMTFKNLLDSDESDDKAVTAMGILTNFDTMISVIESKEVRDELEKIVYSIIEAVLKQGIIDFYEDVLAIMVTATLYQISPLMWSLFYIMYEAFERDGYDFFTDMSSPLHNYLTVDPEVFLSNPKNMEILYTMCQKILADDDTGEDAQCYAAKLLEVAILQFPGRIDQWITPFAQVALARLTRNVVTSELRVMCLQVVVATLYYNPTFLTTILDKLHLPESNEPITVQFFAQWMGDANCFLGLHDRKMFVLGLCSILGINSSLRPKGLHDCASKIIPSLLMIFSGLQRSYEKQALLDGEDSDDDDDDSVEGEDADEGELESDDDELNEDDIVYVENLAKRTTSALLDDDGDEDDETELEAYTTTIDNEDAVDEYSVFKQCLLSIQAQDPVWYNQLTNNLNDEQKQELQRLFVLADQRRAAQETRNLDMQGGYSFASTAVPSNFSFGQS
ncbi:importin-7-like [Dendronephthya gigantea]|uniref:importin-7-like n=1 Tax=Dendronephthya gigantea TaxID=151771 RepID=UPI001068F8B5|nr:importin-7-like [Dendronephthya gigantea]